MRHAGLWHPELLAQLARLGHGEAVVIADPGLPVPRDVPTVDLVWAAGQPPFLPVLQAVCGELVVESAVVAEELPDDATRAGIAKLLVDVPVRDVAHEELKALVARAQLVVRTGETTPYANVLLIAGVPF